MFWQKAEKKIQNKVAGKALAADEQVKDLEHELTAAKAKAAQAEKAMMQHLSGDEVETLKSHLCNDFTEKRSPQQDWARVHPHPPDTPQTAQKQRKSIGGRDTHF